MFFRIGEGAASGDCNRYPALYIINDATPSLILYLSEEDDCSKSYDLSPFGTIEHNVIYHILISFNMTILHVSIAEEGLIPRITEWTRSGTSFEFIGDEVPVWWGSDEYHPADAVCSNITIKSKELSSDAEDDIDSDDAMIPLFPTGDGSFETDESSSASSILAQWADFIVILALSICLLIVVVICVVCFCIYMQRETSKEVESHLAVMAETSKKLKTECEQSPERESAPESDADSEPPTPNEIIIRRMAGRGMAVAPGFTSGSSSGSASSSGISAKGPVRIVVGARSCPQAMRPINKLVNRFDSEGMYAVSHDQHQQIKGPGLSGSYPSLPPTPMTAQDDSNNSPNSPKTAGRDLEPLQDNRPTEVSPLTVPYG